MTCNATVLFMLFASGVVVGTATFISLLFILNRQGDKP